MRGRLFVLAALGCTGSLLGCGGGRGAERAAASPEGPPTEALAMAGAPGARGSNAAASNPSPTAAHAATSPSAAVRTTPHVEMRPPVPSAYLAQLDALGLDPKDLPRLEKLDAKALRGVMKLFSKSLGITCGDCHEDDFAAPTPRKRIATKMWNEYVVKLAFSADGSPVFCDSCHEGRTSLLDRSSSEALGAWMKTAYVDPLERKGEAGDAPMSCETCHENMQMRFLNKWAGLKE